MWGIIPAAGAGQPHSAARLFQGAAARRQPSGRRDRAAARRQ